VTSFDEGKDGNPIEEERKENEDKGIMTTEIVVTRFVQQTV
jgi:hypothetical protein